MEESKNKQNNKDDVNTIHTFQSDLADLMREKQGSVIKIAIAEQEKKDRAEIVEQSKISNPKNLLLVIGGIIIILAGIIFTIFLINKGNSQSVVAPVASKVPTFISYDEQFNLDAKNISSRDVLVKTIRTDCSYETKDPDDSH